jgi:hypothetical protein
MACLFRFPYLVLLCAFVLPFGSCGRSSDDLTATDLASALNAHWWNLEIPEDFDWMLGICFKDERGVLRRSASSSGWEPGSHAKVILMDLDKEKLRFAIVGSGRALSGTTLNKLFNLGENGTKGYPPTGSTVSLDQILVRASESGTVTVDELKKGEIGITLSFEPRD